MTDIASLGIEIDSSSVPEAKSQMELATAAGEKFERTIHKLSAADQFYQTMAAKTGQTVAEVKARYDAASLAQQRLTQAVQEQANVEALATGAMNAHGMSAQKATAALLVLESAQKSFNNEANAAIALLKKAGAVSDEAGGALDRSVGHSSQFRQHLLMLGREVLTGNFSAIPGTLLRLATHAGMAATEMAKLLGPAAAVAGALGLWFKHLAEIEQLNRALGVLEVQLAGSGRAGMKSKEELGAYVEMLKQVGGVAEDAALKIVGSFTKQSSIGREAFGTLIGMVPDFAKAIGEEAPQAAEKLARAFGDPLTGVLNLDKEMNILTLTQYRQIQTMKEHGDAAGIVKIGMEALEARIKGLRTEGVTPLQAAWEDLRKAWAGTPTEEEKATTALGNLAKKVSLIADMVRDAKQDWKDFVEMFQRTSSRVLSMGVDFSPGGEATRMGKEFKDIDAEVAAHDKLLKTLKQQRAADAADREAERLAKQKKDKEDEERRIKMEKEALAEKERMRKLDAAGWVKYIDEMEKQEEAFLKAEAKRWADYYKEKERLAKLDDAGWVKHIDAMEKAEFDRLTAIAKMTKSHNEEMDKINKEAAANHARMWDEYSTKVGDVFADMVMDGENAFERLKSFMKDLLREMIALFAKRWVLNLAAGGSVMGSAGDAAASVLGSGGSLGGTLLSAGASTLGSAAMGAMGVTGTLSGFGSGVAAGFSTGGAIGVSGTMGTAGASLGSAMAGVYSALAAIPVWGWIAMAVIAIGAYIAGNHKGGPKAGGSFTGMFDSSGAMTGSQFGDRLYTPNQMDPAMAELGKGIASSYFKTMQQLGVTPAGMRFGIGMDTDPHGTSDNRVTSFVETALGQRVFETLNRTMGNDDKEIGPALQLEASRMLLAALQASELPAYLAKVFDNLTASSATQDQIQAALDTAMALKSIFDVISRNPLEDVATAIKNSMDPFNTALRNNATAMREVMRTYDGTLASTQNLAAATGQYYNAQLQLLAGITQISMSINEMFSDTWRTIELAGKDPQQQYNFYQQEADTLQALALTSTDPAAIQRYAEKINADIMSAFGLLSKEQQAAMGPQFIAQGRAAQAELEEHLLKIQKEASEATSTLLGEIKEMLGMNSTEQRAAAQDFRAGVDRFAETRIGIDVTVRDDRSDVVVNDGG